MQGGLPPPSVTMSLPAGEMTMVLSPALWVAAMRARSSWPASM